MVFAFQLNFPQSPEDQMFPECELGPSEKGGYQLSVSFLFKLMSVPLLTHSRSVLPQCLEWRCRNTRPDQHLICRCLKFLLMDLQYSLLADHSAGVPATGLRMTQPPLLVVLEQGFYLCNTRWHLSLHSCFIKTQGPRGEAIL